MLIRNGKRIEGSKGFKTLQVAGLFFGLHDAIYPVQWLKAGKTITRKLMLVH